LNLGPSGPFFFLFQQRAVRERMGGEGHFMAGVAGNTWAAAQFPCPGIAVLFSLPLRDNEAR
jgi:hypothetical protein